jgi:hypothetical protein
MIVLQEAYSVLLPEDIERHLSAFFGNVNVQRLLEAGDYPALVELWNHSKQPFQIDYAGGMVVGSLANSDIGAVGAEYVESTDTVRVSLSSRFFAAISKQGTRRVAAMLLPILAHEFIHRERYGKSGGKSVKGYIDPKLIPWWKYAGQEEELAPFAVQTVDEFISDGYPVDVILDILAGSRRGYSLNQVLDTFSQKVLPNNPAGFKKYLKIAYRHAVELKRQGIGAENPLEWDEYWKSVGKKPPKH